MTVVTRGHCLRGGEEIKVFPAGFKLVEARILSEILIRDDTAVLLIRVIGLSGVQFQCKFL